MVDARTQLDAHKPHGSRRCFKERAHTHTRFEERAHTHTRFKERAHTHVGIGLCGALLRGSLAAHSSHKHVNWHMRSRLAGAQVYGRCRVGAACGAPRMGDLGPLPTLGVCMCILEIFLPTPSVCPLACARMYECSIFQDFVLQRCLHATTGARIGARQQMLACHDRCLMSYRVTIAARPTRNKSDRHKGTQTNMATDSRPRYEMSSSHPGSSPGSSLPGEQIYDGGMKHGCTYHVSNV